MKIKVAHITSAHPREDTRIFLKECRSLVEMGYEVHLVVADGKGDAITNGVHIHDAGKVHGRLQRMVFLPWRVWRLTRRVPARLYHFHDPELLLIALPLKWSGAKVVYDSHEDVPRAVLSREWLPARLRKLVSITYEWFEDFVASRLAAIVAATPHIAKRFSRVNPRTIALGNFPLASEVHSVSALVRQGRTVCFLGYISKERGIFEMIEALESADAQLLLAGPFGGEDLERAARALPGWSRVDYRGRFSRQELLDMMAQSRIGLVLFHPEPNHVDAQPNKMFEYMSAGLPVLASDFPLWRDTITNVGAGACVDPLDVKAIGYVLKAMLDDEEGMTAMGSRGREAVLTKYQWIYEEKKLEALYRDLLHS